MEEDVVLTGDLHFDMGYESRIIVLVLADHQDLQGHNLLSAVLLLILSQLYKHRDVELSLLVKMIFILTVNGL